MSEENKNQSSNQGKERNQLPKPEAQKGWIGENKAQQDIIRKGSEIPPKNDNGKKGK
jgi:hypothetical protein